MLGDAGSIGSLVGVVVSLGGLGFAILQLLKLRGETRAARDAAEATRRALGRELASTELARLHARIQSLKEIHRRRDRARALVDYPEILQTLLDIRRRHPGLSEEHREKIHRASTQIVEMENAVEGLEREMPLEMVSEFNRRLTDLQSTLLPDLEDQLQQPA